MPTARTPDGTEITYDVRGTGPINLAMLHGWGGVGGLWFSVARRLDPQQFTCWLIDSRGHGRSAIPLAGYAWDDFASDVIAVADHQGCEQFLPVASSLGGKLSQYLTAKCPERIAAQILVSPVGPGPAPFSLESRRDLARRAADWRELKKAIQSWFGPGVSEATIDSCCRAVSRTPTFVLETTAETLLATSLPEPFQRSAAPALVVIGESDPHYGPEYQRASVLPFLAHAESVTLPCGHFAPMEQTEAVVSLVARFATAHGRP